MASPSTGAQGMAQKCWFQFYGWTDGRRCPDEILLKDPKTTRWWPSNLVLDDSMLGSHIWFHFFDLFIAKMKRICGLGVSLTPRGAIPWCATLLHLFWRCAGCLKDLTLSSWKKTTKSVGSMVFLGSIFETVNNVIIYLIPHLHRINLHFYLSKTRWVDAPPLRPATLLFPAPGNGAVRECASPEALITVSGRGRIYRVYVRPLFHGRSLRNIARPNCTPPLS